MRWTLRPWGTQPDPRGRRPGKRKDNRGLPAAGRVEPRARRDRMQRPARAPRRGANLASPISTTVIAGRSSPAPQVWHAAGVARFKAASLFIGLFFLACAGAGDSKPAAAPTPSAAPPPVGPKVAVVEGSVMLKECPAKLERKKAEKTMNDLVGDCDRVPGGTASFQATLHPGGRIEISAPDGSDQGTVPICVVKHTLKHKLFLAKPCTLAVQIEEKSVHGAH